MVRRDAGPSAPTGVSTGLDLCLRLARANATVGRRLDNTLSSLHGLSFGDFVVLHHLSRAPGRRLRRIDLAERLGLSASGVTRNLLPLEKLGLITREPDPRDARIGYAALSDAGLELLTFALVAVEQVTREIVRTVPVAQLDALNALLGQLAGINLSNA